MSRRAYRCSVFKLTCACFQYQQHNATRADDSDTECYTPRTPRRTPMACTFCRGMSPSPSLPIPRRVTARIDSDGFRVDSHLLPVSE